MVDKIKELLGVTGASLFFISFWLSAPLGIWTAVSVDQAAGWSVLDVFLSIGIPLYGFITWVMYVFF